MDIGRDTLTYLYRTMVTIRAFEERAVRCLERDLHHCLHYYRFPKEVWKQVRTTNILERAFREVRRRTRPMGVFPNEASANWLLYGISKGMHRNGLHPVESQQDS